MTLKNLTRKIALILTLTALSLSAVPPAGAHIAGSSADDELQADCAALCKSQPTDDQKKKNYVVIDANTGARLAGADHFPKGAEVHVFVVNKNPFRYSYIIKIKSTRADAAIASAFLGLIPGFKQVIDQAMGKGPEETKKQLDTSCTGNAILAALKKLGDAADPLLKDGQTLKKELKDKSDANDLVKKAYDPFYARIGEPEEFYAASDFTPRCSSLCESARQLYPKLTGFNLGTLTARVDDFNKRVTAKSSELADLVKAFRTAAAANPACILEKEEYLKTIAALDKDAESYLKTSTGLASNEKKFHQLAEIIKNALASNSAFTYFEVVSSSDFAKVIEVIISRKKLDTEGAQFEPVAVTPIPVGEADLSISAGVGFSTIEDTRIIRQPFAKPDGTVGARFGAENKSTLRPSAVVMLNAHLREFGGRTGDAATFALSTGLVLTNRNDTTEAEFIAGPSIGLLKHTVFLTFGYHAARVERLGSGFALGEEIPANITDPLPVEKNWKGGFMFAITYKLR